MKTALKLLLLSASFLSANAFAESVWQSTPQQPGVFSGGVSSLVMSADGQTILLAERHSAGTVLWRSIDAGKNWSILVAKK
jgi:hypothetical protein